MNTVCAIVMHSTYNKHGLCDVMHRIYKETACPVKVGQAVFSADQMRSAVAGARMIQREETMNKKKSNVVRFNRWGYYFMIPFILIYLIFQFVPLVTTIYNSFFENYRSGLKQIGPNFIGFANYMNIFANKDLWGYFANTMIMWIAGFIPQIFFSLLLAAWFTDPSLRLKGQKFWKTVIYLPNLIMASALISAPIRFLSGTGTARGLIAFMNFIMWFGNTTILLMAGMMGIDPTLFEAAQVDGAKPTQIFWKITLPLLRPILVYTMITSLIGGLQMFDVPQILTNGTGDPARTTMTLIMYLNKHLYSKNFGLAGALSVFLFIITAILSFGVYKMTVRKEN